jgi:hypothetical protein
MPIYTFKNKETNEVEEHSMSVKLLDEFKQLNPHLETYHSVDNLPAFGDGMRMSVPRAGQPDARFEREVIGRIREKVPGNTLSKTHKTKMPREW